MNKQTNVSNLDEFYAELERQHATLNRKPASNLVAELGGEECDCSYRIENVTVSNPSLDYFFNLAGNDGSPCMCPQTVNAFYGPCSMVEQNSKGCALSLNNPIMKTFYPFYCSTPAFENISFGVFSVTLSDALNCSSIMEHELFEITFRIACTDKFDECNGEVHLPQSHVSEPITIDIINNPNLGIFEGFSDIVSVELTECGCTPVLVF